MGKAEEYLKNLINREGPIPLDRFMAEVLYHSIYGYYNHSVPIGREGDYITAPEMTQVFGEVIGLWCYDQWEKLGRPEIVHLIELGPGRGTLMADLLRVIRVVPEFSEKVRVHLVDVSPTLKEIQKKTLQAFPNVEWHDGLESIPDGFSLIIANEFFDALPIKQFFFQGGDWCERLVDVKKGEEGDILYFTSPLRGRGRRPERSEWMAGEGELGEVKYSDGTCLEYSPLTETIATTLSKRLKAGGGACLIIDYGFTDIQGEGDSLQAMKNHQYHPIFDDLGQADLTHHVNFGRLKQVFESSGLYVEGPAFQGDFLKEIGFDLRTEHLCRTATLSQAGSLRTAAARLMSPSHMGHLFKVLSVYSSLRLL